AQAFALKGLDQSLSIACVADGAAGPTDAARQRGLRYDAAAPYVSDQVVAADHALAILDHIRQQIEDLRLERDRGIAAAQLASLRIERIVFEQVAQVHHSVAGASRD